MKKKKIGLVEYFKKYALQIVIYITAVLLGGFLSILTTIIFAEAIECITESSVSIALSYLFFAVLLTVLTRGCWFTAEMLYDKYSVRIMGNLNSDLSRQAFKLNSRTFTSHDTGTFVQRIVTDPERVVDNLASIIDMVADIITSVAMIIYITFLNAKLAIIIVGLIIVSLTIELIRVKVRRKLRSAVRKENDKITSLTTEIVRSERDIKSLGLESKLSEVSDEAYKKYKKASKKQMITDGLFGHARGALIQIVNVLLLVYALILMDKGLLTLATFMLVYSYRNSIYNIVWSVGNVSNRVIEIKVSSKRMFSLFDEEEFVTEKFGNVCLPEVLGDIEFKDVSFTYDEYEYTYNKKTKKQDKKLVSENKIFDGLNFKIPRNTTVAFVGKSGSGKSTILNLIAKMNVVDGGEVLIDGVNINDLDKTTLRKHFSLVNQFPYIFDMTIKENLQLAKADATDEEIHEAIRLASLSEFVDSLPNGIETKVGESGIKLSGGQKQRLAIARAMLRKSSIILFDESTSSLDNFAQEDVKRSIDGLKGKSTIVIVAHRLSTIKDSDIIFFLDNGKIIDSGSFDELYSRNEKFKRMFLAENIEEF